ncbi:uncharacterized protein LOC134749906 isoform X2 [Cydia strobilella]|uniref:uncharacterized protein LOC134749906 isoform X2 n=1 Tax=Cydia strobilella TaxID=1100964 RepID=UPI0030078BBA
MDNDKPRIYKRPEVLKKINAEHILAIERGLLGDLPDRLKPKPPEPVRGRPNNLQLVTYKQPGLLSACLPAVIETPSSAPLTPTEPFDDEVSSLKKSFSFRDKLSKINIFGNKDKPEKNKYKTIEEDENKHDEFRDKDKPRMDKSKRQSEQESKSNKRFWFFRNKELLENKVHSPVYKRSKSFEFLPRALEEEEECYKKPTLSRNQSYVFGSTDTMGDAWTSNESLEYISNVYYDNDDTVFLKSIKEFPSELSSANNSSLSDATSASSGIVANIFKRESVQDLIDEFEKTVDMFSENYLSDSETYTKPKKEVVQGHRRSSSFDTLCLQSPKIVPVSKVDELSEDFKKELSKALEVVKRAVRSPTGRRGSVTDWFVLEDPVGPTEDHRRNHALHEMNKYKRAQKKPANRVRRISSTKYWISPEKSVEYSREIRPPLVIPRITQYRAPRRDTRTVASNYEECTESKPVTVKSSVRQYERLQDWNFEPRRMDDRYGVAGSPPFQRLHKKMSGSSENLLAARRPVHLPLPASSASSGDSLDVEVRGGSGYGRSRKSKSLVPSKRGLRSPVPAPRTVLPESMMINEGFTVIHEGPVKRTKYFEGGKKSKKHWVDCYMVLTPSALLSYKDLRTYQASMLKPPGTPPSPTAPRPELILPLKNAHVIQCVQTQTRRYTKSIELTVSHDRFLLQDDSEEGARRWLREIQNVIYKLGPPTDDNLSIMNQSSNTDLESLGRTPPASRHSNRSKQKAGGSSNEDLSDCTEPPNKSHVRSRLKKFFLKRPSMEQLVKKGIYKDEPVFGRNLSEVVPADANPRVPPFVVACIKEIESNEENMGTDGLYRASGNLSQVQKIRLDIDQNKLSSIEENADIHVLTGSLKLFFRELKEPLIPCNMFDRVLAACSIKPREAKIKEFRDIVNSLPPCNRDTLKYLLEHLLRVTKYSERNRMHTANLAIVFGPTLLWAPAEQAHNIAIDCIQQNNVVDTLLTEFYEIFEEGKGRRKS